VAETAPAVPATGRTDTPSQRAENAYRRALGVLEDGRVTEAIATLQAGLQIDPRHEAARQTLVGLLIEAGRPDDAMRQLQAALAIDARQPALAMLLARLQLERGGPAIDTLTRTLPYAAGNGEYHAFLAGVLQREGRVHEAADHYQAALKRSPGNGVWWMGLGIALQADKRDAESRCRPNCRPSSNAGWGNSVVEAAAGEGGHGKVSCLRRYPCAAPRSTSVTQ
jgi:MSHA biogenesis protein MshN